MQFCLRVLIPLPVHLLLLQLSGWQPPKKPTHEKELQQDLQTAARFWGSPRFLLPSPSPKGFSHLN